MKIIKREITFYWHLTTLPIHQPELSFNQSARSLLSGASFPDKRIPSAVLWTGMRVSEGSIAGETNLDLRDFCRKHNILIIHHLDDLISGHYCNQKWEPSYLLIVKK